MEVKINREIRNYTEAMFFGLSLRQFIFSACACVVAVGIYFLSNRMLARKPYRGCAFWVLLRGSWLYEVQRYDRRESHLCVDKIGVFNAEEARFPFNECVLRADEAEH